MKKKQKATPKKKVKSKSKKARIIMVIGLPALFLLGLFFVLSGIPTIASIVPTNTTIEPKFLIGGDVNNDGAVNIVDSLLIMQHTVKLRQLTSNQLSSADVNKDSNVDIIDVMFIAQYTVGTRKQLLDLPVKNIVAFAESKQLSQMWWKLTRQERWDISTVLIDDFQNQIGTVQYYYDLDGNIKPTAPCLQNAVIRQNKFNGLPDNRLLKSYFYKDLSNIRYGFYSNNSYILPVYFATIDNPYHGVVALQVGENISDFNSWRFFQYSNNDIKVGDWQMLPNVNIDITNPTLITPTQFSGGGYLARFFINSNGEIKNL